MRPKVHTRKHMVQFSLFTVASGALTSLKLASTVEVVGTAVDHVKEGSTISAVYIEMWLTSDDTAAGTAIVTLERLPGTASVMTAAQSAALDDYGNKNNIFHTQMGLLGPNTQYPMAVVKGWFKIPKGKQRMSQDLALRLNVHGQSNGVAGCGFATYKEQY